MSATQDGVEHPTSDQSGGSSRLSIERSALLNLSVASLIAATVVWLVLSSMADVSRLTGRIIHATEVIRAVEVLRGHLVDAETGERGYIITGLPEYLMPYQSALDEVEQHRRHLTELLGNAPHMRARMAELERNIHAKLEIARANIAAAREQGFAAARQRVLTAGGRQRMEAIRSMLDVHADEASSQLATLRMQRQQAVSLLEAEIVIAMLLLVTGMGVFHMRLLGEMRQRRAQEELAEHRAMHDSLTGLPNRRALIMQLEQVLKRCARHQRMAGVLFLDLNGFKAVNDRHGHQAGDALLQQVAQRLTGLVRSTDLVARLGGDEFVVLTEEIGEHDDICRIVGKITREIAEPYSLWSNVTVSVSTSIGVAIYPNDGEQLDDLLSRADTAMYAAKRSGSNCHCDTPREYAHCVLPKQAP